jgi:hypothetical protein
VRAAVLRNIGLAHLLSPFLFSLDQKKPRSTFTISVRPRSSNKAPAWSADRELERDMPDRSIEALLRDSHFVVAGNVERLGAATMTIDPTVQNVGVFRIEEILSGPPVLAGFTGRDITVVFTDLDHVHPGDRGVLFATSWLYGESLAVVEVGMLEEGERATMQDEIGRAGQRLADERLRERLARADLVIAGQVAATALLEGEGPVVSEHDPEWWQAEIDVESVVKGSAGKRVTILFPGSVDIAWSQSPKFEPGQAGIWILQRDQAEHGPPRHRRPGLTALNPLDFRPRDELRYVRRVMPRG